MWLRIVGKAMRDRWPRVTLALAALTVASGLSTALLALYADIESKLRGQFRGYGANLVLSAAGGAPTLPLSALAEADRHGEAAPILYSVQTIRGEPVVLAGTDFRRIEPLSQYWEVRGQRPAAGEALVGVAVAERFQLRPGDSLDLGGESRPISGVVVTGGPEDSQILLPIQDAARLSGAGEQASLIALRVPAVAVEQARQRLAQALPGVEVRVLRAVVESEAGAVLKIRGTMFLLTLLVLAITILSVANNFGAMVHQRRVEIGILKAIGGGDGRLAGWFAAEAAAVALAGSLAGFLLGTLAARALTWQIFRQPAGTAWGTLPAALAVTVAVAVLAVVAPLNRIRAIQPAVILRGE